jgi:hypothetical protein
MTKLSFAQFDKFDRKPFAERLTTAIETFYPFADGAYVLSLNAKFGSGKTSFLKMWQTHLDEQDPKFTTVYINAWENDFDDEPLIPIIHALLNKFREGKKGSKKIEKALRAGIGVVSLTSSSVLDKATGVNVLQIMKAVENEPLPDDILSKGDALNAQHEFKKKAYEELRTQLKNYVTGLPKKPLVIFVDELDRARPDYAVRFLEAIKHIFAVEGVCFVLGVDRGQMKASVRQLYGDVDFENYYRRFVTREVNLPEAVSCRLSPFINHLADEFFNQKRLVGLQFPFKPNEQDQMLDYMKMLSKGSGFAPREIESYFRSFSQFIALPIEDTRTRPKLWTHVALFLISVSIKDKNLYHLLGRGKLSPEDLKDYIESLNLTDSSRNEVSKDVMSACLRKDKNEENNQIADICLYNEGYVKTIADNPDHLRLKMLDTLANSQGGLRHLQTTSMIEEIYSKLESWQAFIL